MDLVFLGSGEFGIPTLAALARDHRVRVVVTQPDRPAGRGLRLAPTPVAAWCEHHLPNVPLVRTENVNDPETRARVRELAAAPASPGSAPGPAPLNDPRLVAELAAASTAAWVVIAFGQKLSPELLDGVFACNLHASLLPRWRGAGPIQAAMLAGDERTGNSVITIAQRMDAGLVLAQNSRPIADAETAQHLHDALAADGAPLVLGVLDSLARGCLTPRPQSDADFTRARKLSRADAWVDFSKTASECRRRINALSPWPGVTVTFRGEPLKLLRAASPDPVSCLAPHASVPQSPSTTDAATLPPGRLLDAPSGIVSCGSQPPAAPPQQPLGHDASSLLRILEVQPAGKRAMTWAEFAGGRRLTHADNGEALHGATAPC